MIKLLHSDKDKYERCSYYFLIDDIFYYLSFDRTNNTGSLTDSINRKVLYFGTRVRLDDNYSVEYLLEQSKLPINDLYTHTLSTESYNNLLVLEKQYRRESKVNEFLT